MGLWDWIEDVLFEVKESIYDLFDDDNDYDNDIETSDREIKDYNRERKNNELADLIKKFKRDMSSFEKYLSERGFVMDQDYRDISDENALKQYIEKSPKSVFSPGSALINKEKRFASNINKVEECLELLEKIKRDPFIINSIDPSNFSSFDRSLQEKIRKIRQRYNCETINVVNLGKLKAGKSSLFNILTGEKEFFATGRTRKTVEIQSRVKNGISFTDTPGTDCYDSDYEKAISAAREADILIYAVSSRRGAVDKEDMSVIQNALKKLPDDGKGRFVTVITQIDEFSNSDGMEQVVKNISSQIKGIAGFDVPVFTSTTRGWFDNAADRKEHPSEKLRKNIFKMIQSIKSRKKEIKTEDVKTETEKIIDACTAKKDEMVNKFEEFSKEREDMEKECAIHLKTILRDVRANFKRIQDI
ncbi:MAG TPA: 50S ribosome-binding GTPase [bacterium]|nr:50S ribosome-binding GTPase [bacterium]